MEYPEEIYKDLTGKKLTDTERLWGEGGNRRHAYEVGHDVGYELGKAEQSDYIESMSSLESVLTDVEQLEGEDLPFVKRLIERTVRAVRAEQADPLAGYSNLTAAIKAGEPIDWERLDGLKTQCVHPDRGTVSGKLERDPEWKANKLSGWWNGRMDHVYTIALNQAWEGKDGWTLWVDGEIPLRRKTADQLKVGTYFLGEAPVGETDLVYVGGCSEASKVIFYAPAMLKSGTPAYGWVVLKERGTFQGPEGK